MTASRRLGCPHRGQGLSLTTSRSIRTGGGGRSSRRPSTLNEALGWHVAWALGVTLGGGLIALTGLTSSAIGALLLALVPPVFAQGLLKFDGLQARNALLALWSVCVGGACALAGGLGGPLTAWCLAPIAVAAVLGRAKMLARGAAFSLAAAAGVILLQMAGLVGPPIGGLMGLCLGGLAVVTTGLGLGASLIMARKPVAEEISADAGPLQGVLDAQPHLILEIDSEGRATSHYGPAPQGVVRSRLASGVMLAARPEDRDAVDAAINRARVQGSASIGFIPTSRLDRHVTLDIHAVGSEYLVGTLRDSTASRDREEVLENARADAESQAAGKSRFLASMSHELRTPLNAIMGFSDIMRQRMFGDLPGKYVEYADLIHESGSHLLDLINDVLDMSKIEADRYELVLEFLDAREPVQAALRIVRMQADEAGVKLRAALPLQPVEAEVDRRALKQIVLNLVSNAIKFTPADGSVTVAMEIQDRDIVLIVVDTGVGISEEDLKRVGRPYEQAGDPGRRSQGTGLGLSLVRAFAELHGGEMTIESRLGAGTAVTVRLPVVHQGEKPAARTLENVVPFAPQR
jgi:two-component system, cell cycle sensor histidine kinase DivJ